MSSFCSLQVPQKEKIIAAPFQAYSGKWKAFQSLSSVEVQTLSRGSTNGFVSRQPTCWGDKGEHSLPIMLKLSLYAADLGLNLLWIRGVAGRTSASQSNRAVTWNVEAGFQFLFQGLFIPFYLVTFKKLIMITWCPSYAPQIGWKAWS